MDDDYVPVMDQYGKPYPPSTQKDYHDQYHYKQPLSQFPFCIHYTNVYRLAVLITRHAISPRLAIKILLINDILIYKLSNQTLTNHTYLVPSTNCVVDPTS